MSWLKRAGGKKAVKGRDEMDGKESAGVGGKTMLEPGKPGQKEAGAHSEIAGDNPEKTENNEDAGKEESEHEIPAVFLSYPVRNELVKWEKRDDGMAVLTYRKNLSRFERWLQRHIGGPLDIKRPLDAPGTRIWELCDRQHTLLEICRIIDEEFKEEMDPVFDKVRRFLEQLLILNLIVLKTQEEIAEELKEEEEAEEESEDE